MTSLRERLSIGFRGVTHRWRFSKRYDVINYFIRAGKYKTYLEIGTGAGRCFERVKCATKTGVDPRPRRVMSGGTIYQTTSDEFFQANKSKFDLIFIDGLHTSDQVIKDIFNGLAALSENGMIVLHDCNPLTEEMQVRDLSLAKNREWNGDVWKVIVFVRKFLPNLFCRVFSFDQGVGIMIPINNDNLPVYTPELEKQALDFFEKITWDDLQKERKNLLGLIENWGDLEREFLRHQMPLKRAK